MVRRREGPRVVLVGKLIVSKGVDLLLAAWPLVHAAQPGRPAADRRVRRVRGGASAPVGGVDARRPRRTPARSPRAAAALEGGEEQPLRDPGRLPGRAAAPGTRGGRARPPAASRFAGRLEHDEVAALVPARRRAGLSEHLPRGVRDGRRGGRGGRGAAGLGGALGRRRGEPRAGRVAAARGRRAGLLPVDDRAVLGIAERLNAWLALDEPTRERARAMPGRDRRVGCGAGRGWRAACSQPRPASSTTSRGSGAVRIGLVPLATEASVRPAGARARNRMPARGDPAPPLAEAVRGDHRR